MYVIMRWNLLTATHSASPGSGKSSSSMEAEGTSGNHDNTSSSLVRVHTEYTPSKTEVDMLHIKVCRNPENDTQILIPFH